MKEKKAHLEGKNIYMNRGISTQLLVLEEKMENSLQVNFLKLSTSGRIAIPREKKTRQKAKEFKSDKLAGTLID